MDENSKRILSDALRSPLKYGISGCVLCDGPIGLTALFAPTDTFAKRIGQPKGKQRLIVYGLCVGCSELPDLTDRVERAVLRDLGTQ